jgi:tRNA A-37 threonylcarbamoyl transferase component Bud32
MAFFGLDPQSQINEVDSNLKFVREFSGSCLNYLVEKSGSLYVLKLAPSKDYEFHEEWVNEHLQREYEVLMSLGSMVGVVELEEVYHTEKNGVVLLKEYIEGHHPSEDLEEHIKEQLEMIVYEIHDQGISNLDLGNMNNILISDDDSNLTLFDFGLCYILGEDEEFSLAKEYDLDNLNEW